MGYRSDVAIVFDVINAGNAMVVITSTICI